MYGYNKKYHGGSMHSYMKVLSGLFSKNRLAISSAALMTGIDYYGTVQRI